MGETIIEKLRTEKYLGDQIHEDETAASIHETLNNKIPIAYERGEDILSICNQLSLIGFNIASGPVEQYEWKISSKLLANSESWIGLNQSHIVRLQKVQDDFFMKMFQVSNYGTMNCMIQLDSQTMKLGLQYELSALIMTLR